MLEQPLLQPLTDPLLERILVTKLIADPEAIRRIGDLDANAMTDPTMAAALQAALDLAKDGRPINIVSLKPLLDAVKTGFDRTAFAVLMADPMMKLPAGTVASESYPIEDVAKRLQYLRRRREFSALLHAAAEASVDEGVPMVPVVVDLMGQGNEFIAASSRGQRTQFDLHESSLRMIERLQQTGDPIEIPTGLTDLDKHTGGWHRGQFTILAGRPSMGKSATALASMLRTAEKGFGVYFASLEMTEDQIVTRALADYAYTNPPIAYSDLRPGSKPTESHIRRLEQAAERFRKMPIVIDTKAGVTVGAIMARARQVQEKMEKAGTPLALVVVDHLLKVRPSDRYAGQPVKELDEISEGMCVMAKSLNVAVLGLHQLNREVEKRDNPRAVMSDLRGSGSLEQDADVILLCHRPAYRFERQLEDPDKRAEAQISAEALKHDLEIQIAKQRNGPTVALEFFCDMAANVVRDRSWLHK